MEAPIWPLISISDLSVRDRVYTGSSLECKAPSPSAMPQTWSHLLPSLPSFAVLATLSLLISLSPQCYVSSTHPLVFFNSPFLLVFLFLLFSTVSFLLFLAPQTPNTTETHPHLYSGSVSAAYTVTFGTERRRAQMVCSHSVHSTYNDAAKQKTKLQLRVRQKEERS